MKKIRIASVTFALDGVYTRMTADGSEGRFSGANNPLHNKVIRAPMSRWLLPYQKGRAKWPGFLKALCDEINEREIHFDFIGTEQEYALFGMEMRRQQELLEREKIVVRLAHAGQRDMQGAAKAMYDMLLYIRAHAHGFCEEHVREATRLRRLLVLENSWLEEGEEDTWLEEYRPVLEPWSVDGPVRTANAGRRLEEADLMMHCMALDAARMSVKEMADAIAGRQQDDICAVRCYVIHEDGDAAGQAASELQREVISRGVCMQAAMTAATLEEAERDIRLCFEDGRYRQAYMNRLLGACAAKMQSVLERDGAHGKLEEKWTDFCRAALDMAQER